jgi:hypothetical protein
MRKEAHEMIPGGITIQPEKPISIRIRITTRKRIRKSCDKNSLSHTASKLIQRRRVLSVSGTRNAQGGA